MRATIKHNYFIEEHCNSSQQKEYQFFRTRHPEQNKPLEWILYSRPVQWQSLLLLHSHQHGHGTCKVVVDVLSGLIVCLWSCSIELTTRIHLPKLFNLLNYFNYKKHNYVQLALPCLDAPSAAALEGDSHEFS